MRNILSGARGMSPVVLVILIAWALLSVIFLTGTLLAARSIDRSVSGVTNRTDDSGKPEKNIATTVDEIKAESTFIDEARKTVAISTAIRKAAAPLSQPGTDADTAEKGIDPKLKSILGKVGTINATAGEINGTVKDIGGTVDSIFASVISINGHVKHIGSLGVNIRTSANQINGSARSILGQPLVGPVGCPEHRHQGHYDQWSGTDCPQTPPGRSCRTSTESCATSASITVRTPLPAMPMVSTAARS